MAQTFSSTLHLSSSSVPATAAPVSMCLWTSNSGGQGRRIMVLSAGASETTGVLGLLTDTTGSSNKVNAYRVSSAGSANQALTSVAATASTWQHWGVVFASTTSAASFLNGGNKGLSTPLISPATLTQLTISGRPSDFAFGIGGQAAHAAAWSRALSDTEMAYLGAGGNPRAVKSCVSYWKMASGETPVIDQIGTNDLTPSATIGAGTSDPNFQTHMTGGPVGNLSYTAGTAITSINLTAGHVFDDVSSAFTSVLSQLGTAVSLTTTTGALTAAREVPVSSATGIAAGDYIKLTSGGTPTRVLVVNGTDRFWLRPIKQPHRVLRSTGCQCRHSRFQVSQFRVGPSRVHPHPRRPTRCAFSAPPAPAIRRSWRIRIFSRSQLRARAAAVAAPDSCCLLECSPAA
jgi:hypothetical protein